MKLNFKQFINESPLVNYVTSINPQNNQKRQKEYDQESSLGYFSKKDIKIITNPKTTRILKEKLKNIGYNINILLYEKSKGNYTKEIEEYIQNNNIPTENHITFVKNGSTGDFLTPWMIFHTFGHAVQNYQKINPPSNSLLNCFELGFQLQQAKNLFMFKSAQNMDVPTKRIIDFAELENELIAEFLWNAKIRIKQPQFLSLAECIENKIKQSLNQCVGKIIYDWDNG